MVSADNKSRQYSDTNPTFTATYTGFKNSQTLATSGVTGSPSLTTTATPSSPIANYTITTGAGNLASGNYSFSLANGSLTVTQEDAQILYTGDTIGLTGTNATLRATVWDSAAAGYTSINPETSGGTIGDISKMYVVFDIYTATSCGTGTPTTTTAAQVSDGTAVNDGIGTATATYSSNSEASFCVVARLVGQTGGASVNQWFKADPAEASVLTFYNNTGQFVTGGGWILDPNGSHGNFGFNARFNKNGSPQGQMVYVYRGLYNGVLVDFRIKSNSLTSLGFSCWNGTSYATCPTGSATYPSKGILQGKSTIQINRVSDGYVLYSDGNATFNATVTDSGQSSGIGSDDVQLTVYDKNAVLYKSIPKSPLEGGNVVIHPAK
jgi:MBG domain (YGX type)